MRRVTLDLLDPPQQPRKEKGIESVNSQTRDSSNLESARFAHGEKTMFRLSRRTIMQVGGAAAAPSKRRRSEWIKAHFTS